MKFLKSLLIVLLLIIFAEIGILFYSFQSKPNINENLSNTKLEPTNNLSKQNKEKTNESQTETANPQEKIIDSKVEKAVLYPIFKNIKQQASASARLVFEGEGLIKVEKIDDNYINLHVTNNQEEKLFGFITILEKNSPIKIFSPSGKLIENIDDLDKEIKTNGNKVKFIYEFDILKNSFGNVEIYLL